MIDGGSFESRIEVGIRPGVLTCVISECLMKTFSIENTFAPCQRVHKLLNFSYAVLRKSLDLLDKFLLLHDTQYSTGDIGSISADGKFSRFLARSKSSRCEACLSPKMRRKDVIFRRRGSRVSFRIISEVKDNGVRYQTVKYHSMVVIIYYLRRHGNNGHDKSARPSEHSHLRT